MKKLFGGIFGRAEKVAEEPEQRTFDRFSQYDPEYIEYCILLEQTISALEEHLHDSDDPKEIAIETLQVACNFYGGDWAGILDVDLDLDVWTPLWWYNPKRVDRTLALFGEFEIAKFMPNWVESLRTQTPIKILDPKTVQSIYPEEYRVYERLEVGSVIGVPFGPNPVGFLVIRNPTRFVDRPSMMNILAYVLHRAMAQQKTIDSARMALSSEEIKTDKDIIINFFGSMALYTSQGVLREQEFNAPRSSRVATYLLLNRKSAHTPMEIAEALWPEEPDKLEANANYIRGYVHTFRKSFDLVSKYQLIESSANGYRINPEFNIMSDLQQFDLLWDQALTSISVSHKVELLKQAFALYKGPVFENACDEHWILPTVTHYKLRYIGIVNELLSTLNDTEDYVGIQQYAPKAIELAPENYKAYYWLIRAMVKLGTIELAKNEIAHAKSHLTSEEFASLKKLVINDGDLPSLVLLDEA